MNWQQITLAIVVPCVVLFLNFLAWREFPYEDGFDRFLLHGMATILGLLVGVVVAIILVSYPYVTAPLFGLFALVWVFIYVLDRYLSEWRSSRFGQ